MKTKIILSFAVILCYLLSSASLFAECDTPPSMLAPEGGSVWDKALANPDYHAGSGGDTDADNDGTDGTDSDNGSSDSSQPTGGRLVDPTRDVYWSDGTITPDALNP